MDKLERVKLKKGQSEMVGFGIIVIVVAIIILIVVSLTLNKPQNDVVESYKTESFIQSLLQTTTSCQVNTNYQSYLQILEMCGVNATCDDGTASCDFLNSTSREIIKNSWNVGPQFPVKGYKFLVDSAGKNLLNLTEGNKTNQNRGSTQTFSGDVQVTFIGYY